MQQSGRLALTAALGTAHVSLVVLVAVLMVGMEEQPIVRSENALQELPGRTRLTHWMQLIRLWSAQTRARVTGVPVYASAYKDTQEMRVRGRHVPMTARPTVNVSLWVTFLCLRVSTMTTRRTRRGMARVWYTRTGTRTLSQYALARLHISEQTAPFEVSQE